MALELARKLEPKFRERGYHIGLTGSSLYGREDGKDPEDIDLFVYWHSDIEPANSPSEVLEILGIKFTDALPNPEYPTSRQVLKSSYRQIPVDFIFFTPGHRAAADPCPL